MKVLSVHLHTSFFLNGKNFKDKVNSSELLMVWDEKRNRLLAKHNGVVGIIHGTNIAAMITDNQDELKKYFEPDAKLDPARQTHVSHAQSVKAGNHAQVSDPTTQVQNPPGKI